MAYFRPRRKLLERAFTRALGGEKAKLIDQTPVTGMNIDAAFMIVKKTESLRDKYGRGPGSILRGLVRQAAVASGLPPDRRYGYEVLVMNYYGLIQGFVRDRRKEVEAIRAARRKQLETAA